MRTTRASAAPGAAVRKGTGLRRSGRESAGRIIRAARALLMRSGPAQFSMRNVAAEAGLHLANVQYYFPTRADLVRALLEDTGQRYQAAYDRCLAGVPADPVARFDAVLRFNLRDIATRTTRRFFIQLWALLDRLHPHAGPGLNQLYETDIAQLSELIAQLSPGAEPAHIRRRATLLAATIEGLLVVHGAHSTNAEELRQLMDEARALGFAIARGSVRA